MTDDTNRIAPSLQPLSVAGLAPIHSEIRLRLIEGWPDYDIIARIRRFFRLTKLEAQREIMTVRNEKARTIYTPEARVIPIRGTK